MTKYPHRYNSSRHVSSFIEKKITDITPLGMSPKLLTNKNTDITPLDMSPKLLTKKSQI